MILETLITAIDEAISNGEGHLTAGNLKHEMERRGLRLVDDRDPPGTEPNNEVMIDKIIDAHGDALMAHMGDFSRHRFEYELQRQDLHLAHLEGVRDA